MFFGPLILLKTVNSAQRHKRHRQDVFHLDVLPQFAQTLQALPSFLGEKDVIKTLQLLPGVAAGTEGVAGMYVRGGNLDENLYLVDGNPLADIQLVADPVKNFVVIMKDGDIYKNTIGFRTASSE